ncbi:MAG: BMC domain-containing protein [Desulfitobacterium sp.]
MQALGLIETRGLLPAIESADVMLKTAQVELVGRTFVGGGLVTIAVTGEVGAVKAAVEAGTIAVEKISHSSLVSQHVIPRPHSDIESIVIVSENPAVVETPPRSDDTLITITEESIDSTPITLKHANKDEVDAIIQSFGLEKGLEALKTLSVVKLRNLAREYKELDIVGRAISKANKELLVQQLKGYYEKGVSE